MGDHAGIVSDVRFAPPVSSTDSVAAVGGTTDKAFIAQMVERKTLNLVVVGSIPTGGAFLARPLSHPDGVVAAGSESSAGSRFSSVGRASD